MLLRARIVLTPASIKLCAIAGYRVFHALSCTAHFIPIMQSSVYATCTDWNFFRGIPYLLQRGVDSLSHTAQCQWAASVDLLPCCKKSYSCGEAHFRSGLFVTQYRICVHTLDCHLRAAKKQQARRSSARGKLESEKVGLPWA